MSSENAEISHESYGLVSFSRKTGNPGKLFGSALENHFSYITLSVRKGKLIRDGHGYDRYYGSMRGDVIEVDLSAAQFAELLTTMNVGMGTPCTIRSVNGIPCAAAPELDSEAETVRSDFKERMKNTIKTFQEGFDKTSELLEKKSLSKKDREEILSTYNRLIQELATNAPYYVELFEEASEKVVQSAKAEVDAFTASVVSAVGLQAIKQMGQNVVPSMLQLESKESE